MTPLERRSRRVATLVAAYGSDPSRWPSQERALMFAAVETSDALHPAMLQARELDDALAALSHAPAPATDLRRRLLLAVEAESRGGNSGAHWAQALWAALGGARLAAPALTLALALGLGLGWLSQDAIDEATRSEDLLALAQLEEHYAEIEP